jgi:dihydroorotate dehydrogenase
MGLTFTNSLGIAAGIDRTGSNLVSLAATGVGHVEVGTVTIAKPFAISREEFAAEFKVGINFASPDFGINADVIEDYAALLRIFWPHADYLVANLSSPFSGRSSDTAGVQDLIERLAEVRDELLHGTACSKPLLIKSHAGPVGSELPKAIACARKFGLEGVVLVSSSIDRLAECISELGGWAVISVGGIGTAADAEARLSAGARLVQTYSIYASDGSHGVRRLLGDPDT